MKTATNKMFLQWRGSVSSLLSVSLFTLCRWTGRNWSALAFRFAPLLRPPMPATAETQTLAASHVHPVKRLVIMKILSLAAILTIGMIRIGLTQITPESKGFKSYQIKLKSDTINFFIYNPDNVQKKDLLIHIDGSLPAPLWIETNPCCVTLDPFNYNLISKHCAYVVISKHGFSFSAKEGFAIPSTFWIKNTLDFRVARVNRVIKYIQNNLFKPDRIVVIGSSQGADVAAKLATINRDITHLGFWASGGTTQLLDFITFIRKDFALGKIKEEKATKIIDSLLNQFKIFFNDPSPYKMWDGNSYLSYKSFSYPPIDNLLKIDIPIYVAIGTADENVPIENAYIIPIEFARHKKDNLTFKPFLGYDHGFSETLSDGRQVAHWDKVTLDFLSWVERNDNKKR